MIGMWRCSGLRFILICILVTFIVSLLMSTISVTSDTCNCQAELRKGAQEKSVRREKSHRLAILVPFRDRFDELLEFAPHMTKFLQKQNIDHHIFVLNQIDKFRFNRASLINVGFLKVEKDFDYVAIHDVDLLPINHELVYSFPDEGPYHISSPHLHPRYHYPTFVGGILLIRRKHFIQVNGMSNKYWGWGLEDDEFYVRLKEAGLPIKRPQNVSTGTRNTFRHVHDRNRRKRDTAKCYNQREATRKRDRLTGLDNVSYKILAELEMTIEGTPLTVLNILLNCNKFETPWCECDGASELHQQ